MSTIAADAPFFGPYLTSTATTLASLYDTDINAFQFIWAKAYGYQCQIPQKTLQMLKARLLLDCNGKIFPPVQKALKHLYPDCPGAPLHCNCEFIMILPDGSAISRSLYLTIGDKLVQLKKTPELFHQLADAIKTGKTLSESKFLELGFTDKEGNVLPAVQSVYDCLFLRGRLPPSS